MLDWGELKIGLNITKEGLIISLLKSERRDEEHNYMKHFCNNTNDDTNDHTYNVKIRDKISDIRMILSRLGNTATNNDRKKIKKRAYEIGKRKTFQIRKKKRFMMILLN